MGRPHGAWREQESLSLTTFADATDKYKPFTYDQEQELGHRIQAGDMEAADQLVLHNLKFCLSYVKKFTGRGVPMDDLVSASYYGMIRASRRFKPGHGKFISYAVWHMRNEMQRCIDGSCGAVSYPPNTMSKHMPKVARAIEENLSSGGRFIGADDISDRYGIGKDYATAVCSMMKTTVSLSYSPKELSAMSGEFKGGELHRYGTYDARDGWDSYDTPFIDRMEDDKAESPDACAEREDKLRLAKLLLEPLTNKQRYVVEQMFIVGRTQIDIANELGQTRQAVSHNLINGLRAARRHHQKLLKRKVLQ